MTDMDDLSADRIAFAKQIEEDQKTVDHYMAEIADAMHSDGEKLTAAAFDHRIADLMRRDIKFSDAYRRLGAALAIQKRTQKRAH